MIAATIGYLAGRARMEGRDFDLCKTMQYDSQKKFFETTPELSKMLYVYELTRRHSIDNAEQRTEFINLLNFIEKDSENLPFYLLPIAYASTKDCLANVIQTAYEAAKRLTDNERIIRNSVLAVALLRWSMKKLGNSMEYLERLSGMNFSVIMQSKDRILKSILIGCNPNFLGYDLFDVYSTMNKAILLSVKEKEQADVCASIAAELAEYNHEEGGYQRMVEQLTGSCTEDPMQDIGAEEYPLTDRVQYQTKEGMTLEGYKRMDGYYGWHVQCHSFDFCLIGTEEKPFDKELVYWMWLVKNWNPQVVIQAANDFLSEFHFTVQNNTDFYMDWFNKQIKIPFKGNELAVDFWNLKFDLDISLNAFVMEAEDFEQENEDTDLDSMDESTESVLEENRLDDELTMPLNCIPSIDSYLAIHKYGRMTWNDEKLNEAIQA